MTNQMMSGVDQNPKLNQGLARDEYAVVLTRGTDDDATEVELLVTKDLEEAKSLAWSLVDEVIVDENSAVAVAIQVPGLWVRNNLVQMIPA